MNKFIFKKKKIIKHVCWVFWGLLLFACRFAPPPPPPPPGGGRKRISEPRDGERLEGVPLARISQDRDDGKGREEVGVSK